MEHRSLSPDFIVSNDDHVGGNKCTRESTPDVAPQELRKEEQMGGPVNCNDSELSIYLQALLTQEANKRNILAWILKRAENAVQRSQSLISISQTVLPNLGAKIAPRITRKTFTRKTRSVPWIGQETGGRSTPIKYLPEGRKIDRRRTCMNYETSTALVKMTRPACSQRMVVTARYAAFNSAISQKEVSTIATKPGKFEGFCVGDVILFWGL